MPEEDLSIEEILKSIRHILSEEKEGDALPRDALGDSGIGASVKGEEKSPAPSDVFVLTEEMRVQENPLFSREELKERHRPFIKTSPLEKKEGPVTSLTQMPWSKEQLEEKVIPLIQKWLDEHLPTIVERVVEREIKALLRR